MCLVKVKGRLERSRGCGWPGVKRLVRLRLRLEIPGLELPGSARVRSRAPNYLLGLPLASGKWFTARRVPRSSVVPRVVLVLMMTILLPSGVCIVEQDFLGIHYLVDLFQRVHCFVSGSSGNWDRVMVLYTGKIKISKVKKNKTW